MKILTTNLVIIKMIITTTVAIVIIITITKTRIRCSRENMCSLKLHLEPANPKVVKQEKSFLLSQTALFRQMIYSNYYEYDTYFLGYNFLGYKFHVKFAFGSPITRKNSVQELTF